MCGIIFGSATVGFAPAPVSESIVLDADTGRVLSEANADAITYPASLTKMMTLYLTFEALNTGRLRLDQLLPVSVEAASKSPTKLELRPGESVAVQDLILGIVTKSANDAAAVLAEGLAGSEPAFADLMNRKAQQLGMRNTFYRNASGLPDPWQHTTARDTAQLALALYHDFPREYRYFSTREFVFRGPAHRRPRPFARLVSRRRRHQDRLYPRLGLQPRDLGGARRASADRRRSRRHLGRVSRPRDGGAARPRVCLARRRCRDDRPRAARRRAPAPVCRRRQAPVVAAAEQAPPPAHAKPGIFSKAAARLAAHLSPVGKAEAATLPH